MTKSVCINRSVTSGKSTKYFFKTYWNWFHFLSGTFLGRIAWMCAAHWQWVTFGIKHPLVQGQHRVVWESQIQVLESGAQKFRCLIVVFFRIKHQCTVNARISTVRSATMLIEWLCKFPRIISIGGVVSQASKYEVTLCQFKSKVFW